MQALDAAAVTAWASACVHSLDVLRPAINGINVYPVADSDTGSNLLHTMTGARDELAAEPGIEGAGQALSVLARGAVTAARGNSGVILSQVLRGLAESVAGQEQVDGRGLAAALAYADRVATEAVARPVAGTMLSVLHAVAGACGNEPGSLDEVAAVAAKASAAALEETPRQLPVLATAGVVDAGGRGLVAVLDALSGVISGTSTPPTCFSPRRRNPMEPVHSCEASETHADAEPAPYAWEVMYLLDGVEEPALPALRKTLSGLGDSVTVAGDGAGSHAVHVHCADIGAAIEAGIEAGRPRRIRVEPLITPAPLEPAGIDRTVVAIVHGGPLADLIRVEGVAVLAVPPGETPSVEEMLGLITERAVGHVTVLPGGVELTAAADAVTRQHAMIGDRDVVVIPCASPVQVLAALAVYDQNRRANDDVVAMAEAAAATRRGELVVAQEESLTWVGRAQAGDVIGLVDGEVVLIESAPASVLDFASAGKHTSAVLDFASAGKHTSAAETSLVAAAMKVLNRMLALGGELVTVLTGVGAPVGVDAELAEQLRIEHPEVELVSYAGGQADAVLLIGVE